MRNIPHNQFEHGNIQHNIVSPAKHYYGYEYCYEIPLIFIDII